MKKRKVWRYTCEFCKKSGCSGGAISTHEKHCCRNPARACRMCKTQWPRAEVAPVMVALREIDDSTEEALTKQLEEVTGGCPACMLTALLQAPLPMVEWDNPGEYHFGTFHEGSHSEYRFRVKWDFKKALAQWWAAKNEAVAEQTARDELFG